MRRTLFVKRDLMDSLRSGMEALDAASRRAPLDVDGEVEHVGASVACRVDGIDSQEDSFWK